VEQAIRKGNGICVTCPYIHGMDWTSALIAAAWAIILGGVGGALTDIGPWYRELKKPRWQPPDWLFGPAWTIILGLAGWSFYIALTQAPSPEVRMIVFALFGANFVLHFLWSPLFFKLRRPDWALAENVLLWCSVTALMVVLPRVVGDSFVGWLNVPYFIWVSFAFVLNATIVKLNAPFGAEGASALSDDSNPL
jgi:tryptophan-rich sensory protein